MGKISPPSIKYIISAKFVAEGVVEKPDVIGAIFGQTEGLLGEELELRELQKKGKIGRINVELSVNESQTKGDIEIPTSVDKAETTIIAAAIETIDRVGPCDARFEIKNVEDVRSSKREYIVERAKKLLEKMGHVPGIREMEQDIVNHTKTARIREYGRELLAAGPDIENNNELIVVEGRADVLNLLRCSIKNVIAMNGTVIPETIKKLSQNKDVTLFVDGDRGGLLIATDAINNAKVLFIARAPDGKEVEELAEKEILICLRNKLPKDEFAARYLKEKRKTRKKERIRENVRDKAREKEEEIRESRDLSEDEKLSFQVYLQEISDTKNALLLEKIDDNIRVKKITQSEIIRALYDAKKRHKKVYAIIMDGTVTHSIVRAAEYVSCSYIVAKNFAATSNKIKLLSF